MGGAAFYFPISGLGVSEAYETAGAAIQTEVWLKVVYSFQNELAIEQDATRASNCYVILESLY